MRVWHHQIHWLPMGAQIYMVKNYKTNNRSQALSKGLLIFFAENKCWQSWRHLQPRVWRRPISWHLLGSIPPLPLYHYTNRLPAALYNQRNHMKCKRWAHFFWHRRGHWRKISVTLKIKIFTWLFWMIHIYSTKLRIFSFSVLARCQQSDVTQDFVQERARNIECWQLTQLATPVTSK